MRYLKLSVLGLALAAAVAVALDSGDAIALSRGPFLEHSNAPGEANCTQCHRTYPLDSGPGKVEILGLPERYEPSHIYPITVRISDPRAHEWGFQITAVTDDGGACGFFQTESPGVAALGPSQKYGRFYAEHTILGVYQGQTDSAEWQFKWKAPAEDLGQAHFYACGNAANADRTDFYDYIYSTTVSIDGLTKNIRVSLVSPTASDRIGSGERTDVRWTASDGDAAVPTSFRILLSIDGGASYPTVIADNLPADARSYVWDVPEALATDSARVRIVAVDSAGVEHMDQSRADIEIEPLGLDRATAAFALPTGGPAREAAWADVDGDGLPDVAVARSAGGPLLLRQTASGAFEDITVSSHVAAIGDARAVAWADANGDGSPDLAVVSPHDISIYLNDGQGVFTNVGAPTSLPRPDDPRAVAWTDVDGDGRPDLLVATASGLIAVRNGVDGFVDMTAAWGAPTTSLVAVAAGPLVALGGPAGLTLLRFESGRFVDVTATAGATTAGVVTALAWGDVTGDGTLDVVVGTSSGVRALAGSGGDGARYKDATTDLGLGGLGPISSLALGDYDVDGRLDLFLVSGGAPRVLKNRAGAPYLDVTSRFELDAATVAGAWVDLDGSGATDLVALEPSSALALTNPRSGAAAVRLSANAGVTIAVDLDGDGNWATGPKTARVADGLGVVVAAPGTASVVVRADFAARGGIQVSATTGGSVVAPVLPTAVPVVSSVRVAGAKLVVDGVGLPAVGSIEVAGSALERVKAPAAYRDANGTSRRLVGKDAQLATLVGARPVVVRVFDPATGLLTAPALLR